MKNAWTLYGHWGMQKRDDYENRPFCKSLRLSNLKKLEMYEISFSGERGIRTPGTLLYAGFQDQCIRPLCHLSFLIAMQM